MSAPAPDVVSIVIPTHNRWERLLRALGSVRAQTWSAIEIIVIDDGSTDATATRLNEFAAADPPIRTIRNDRPRGGAAARNQGIAAATGRWIAFLDDDDVWLPTKIERQVVLLDSDPSASAVSCWYYYKAGFRGTRLRRVQPVETSQELLRGNSLGGASVCLASAGTLRRIGGFDDELRSAQDWDLWLRLSREGRILVCDEPLVSYDSHHGARISRNVRSAYAGRRRAYFRYRHLMEPATRKTHLAALTCLRTLNRRRQARRDWRMFRRIWALGGAADLYTYFNWYVAAYLDAIRHGGDRHRA